VNLQRLKIIVFWRGGDIDVQLRLSQSFFFEGPVSRRPEESTTLPRMRRVEAGPIAIFSLTLSKLGFKVVSFFASLLVYIY
jgi:hypothetical protein